MNGAIEDGNGHRRKVRLAYVVSHPIQYQAPLLRRIAQEPDIDLTVLFGSGLSVRGYSDPGFGVEVAWDVPLVDGYAHEFLRPLRDTGRISAASPISRGLCRRLRADDGSPAFDAVWVHGYASVLALQAILTAWWLGVPLLLRAESWAGDRERSGFKQAVKRLFFAALRPAVAAVLPIGSLNAAYWRASLGPDVPQFSMPYAVDNAWFAARVRSADRSALRAEWHLDAARPVILFASKLQRRKRAADLVAAYASLLQQLAQAGCGRETQPQVLIVGDGEERGALERQVLSLGLTDVHFAGFRNQTELPAFFALADVFVLPSEHEPWGLVVNEAMASGCAVVVSSDVGCHADLVGDGVEGLVVPVGDIAALTLALQKILTTPGASALMGRAARERLATWSFEQDVCGLRAALESTTRKLRA